METIKYLEHKMQVMEANSSHFVIPAHLSAEFAEYKLLYWRLDHLLNSLTPLDQNLFVLSRYARNYLVYISDADMREYRERLKDNSLAQIKLSLRQPRAHFKLPAYCLLKLPAAWPKGAL